MEKKVLEVAEVAELVRAHPATVRRWLRDGLLPGQKNLSGHKWLVRREDLAAAAPELQAEQERRTDYQ